MTTISNGHSLLTASRPVVCALLDEAIAKGYRGGVLGVQATPAWTGPDEFIYAGRSVRVAPCPSTLAVWEALRGRSGDGWLVVLTPRDADDLGAGALTHFIWNRLRTPDPWQAVQQRFAAVSLDPGLYRSSKPREVATGLLAALPGDGWPPARGGVLTRNHALDSVVRAQLGVVERGVEVDVTAVLEWSLRPEAPAALADLRALAGDPLSEAVIDWLAGRCGLAETPIRALLRGGRVSDLVPLGLVAGLLSTDEPGVARAVGQFEGTYGLGRVRPDMLRSWHGDASGLTTQALSPDLRRKVVTIAATRMRDLGISELANVSDLLPAGLQARLNDLAKEVREVVPAQPQALSPGDGLDKPLVHADLARLEQAWEHVGEHHLAATDDTAKAFEAIVRLVRWLATDVSSTTELDALLRRHVADDAWVDSAVNDALAGTADVQLAEEFAKVLDVVRLRRSKHDSEFGVALSSAEQDAVLVVEKLLPETIVPLAKKHPVLLVVIDGLSVAVATELLADAAELGWVEHGLPTHDQRAGALAVLPTLTEFSRCSLLSGELRQGDSATERAGFAKVLKSSQLGAAGDVGARTDVPLFHQKQLDSVPPGQSLAPQIQSAIADIEKHRLVSAVLNTVDDTLHHTDPGGTEWKLSTIRHLKPLLEAARRADRTVVITSDHGHVVERRLGHARKHEAIYGLRTRADNGHVEDGEVRVRGSRVLTGDGSAILAVDERLRYGPINAGYHGGGSPAEVVVPVVALHAGEAPADSGLSELEKVAPSWWRRSPHVSVAHPVPAKTSKPASKRRRDSGGEGLFELASPPTPSLEESAAKVAKSVVASKTFLQQRSVAGRVPVSDDKIVVLLTSLLGSGGRRIPAARAAADLGIAVSRFRGALPLLKRLLDVEGYVVLSYEAESGDVVLDEAMLREQYGLGA